MYVFYVWFSFEFQISLQCISMHLKSPIQANSMISSFYRWENWGTERLNNLLKLTCTEIQIPCGGQELLILGFNMAACTFSKMIHYAHVTFYRRLSRSSNSWCLPLDHQLLLYWHPFSMLGNSCSFTVLFCFLYSLVYIVSTPIPCSSKSGTTSDLSSSAVHALAKIRERGQGWKHLAKWMEGLGHVVSNSLEY